MPCTEAGAATPVLQAGGVEKRFGRTVALAGVDLEVFEGEAVALIGPNGSGKTTLLRICATLSRPNRGEVRLLGVPARRDGATRGHIGYLGHDTLLYPDLSAEENLRFSARLYRVPQEERRIAELIERLGIRGWHHRPVRTLSRGMQQRAAVARLFLHRPRALLLDEPFTALDREGAALLEDLLEEARTAGAAIVLTTHDLARAARLCDRTVVLRHGRVAWAGRTPARDAAGLEALYAATGHAPPGCPANGRRDTPSLPCGTSS